MERPSRVLRVGLTGGIASGKTTVAGMLQRLGTPIIDADVLARRLLEPDGAAFAAVCDAFGARILDGEGRIDRTVLARVVFAETEARQELERIVHPLVRAEAFRLLESEARRSGSPIGVIDAALLVETGAHLRMDRLIVVRCSRETQIRRLISRDGLNRAEAEVRIAAQAPLERKLRVADYVIDTEVEIDTTRRRVHEIHAALLRDARNLPAGC